MPYPAVKVDVPGRQHRRWPYGPAGASPHLPASASHCRCVRSPDRRLRRGRCAFSHWCRAQWGDKHPARHQSHLRRSHHGIHRRHHRDQPSRARSKDRPSGARAPPFGSSWSISVVCHRSGERERRSWRASSPPWTPARDRQVDSARPVRL